jgi:hypothetical protein
MHSLVDGYAHAIETNNRELALWFVHPRAPSRSELDTELRDQLESYQERARTTHLEAMPQVEGSASASVDQEFIRIVGLKFIRDHRRRVFHFRAAGDVWRIWAIAEPKAQWKAGSSQPVSNDSVP